MVRRCVRFGCCPALPQGTRVGATLLLFVVSSRWRFINLHVHGSLRQFEMILGVGEACDPETGDVIPCGPGYNRPPHKVYRCDMTNFTRLHKGFQSAHTSLLMLCRGKTAKEISVQILELEESGCLCSHMEHANYLGREFQKAEFSLLLGVDYVQD